MKQKNYATWYKAYDIRSIYQEPIDGTFCYNLWRGIGRHLLEAHGEDATFVFGADVREANNELIYRFLKWLEVWWCENYVGIGIPVEAVDDEQQQMRWVASTMMLYYATKYTFTMWAVFTASHNGPEYVWMKIINNEALLVESDVLQSRVDEYIPVPEEVDEKDFERIWNKAMGDENTLYPLVEEKIQTFSAHLWDRFSSLEKTYTFVVDFSNGAAVWYERIFLEEIVALGWHTVVFLNEKADSDYKAHLSDTTDPHDYKQLQAKIKEIWADFGIMFDGDADRLGFVDEEWTIVWWDIVSGMIALNMLQRDEEETGGKKKIIHDVFFTKAILEAIQEAWWETIKSRVGHRFVKEMFKKEDALFGGELSAHLFFGEIGGFESPLLALYYMMDEVASYEKVSEAIAPYMKYYKPALKKYIVASRNDIDAVYDRIKEEYKDYTLDYTDGVWVYGDDFWFVIRASNTEPVLKMVMEANTQEIWEREIIWLEVCIAS